MCAKGTKPAIIKLSQKPRTVILTDGSEITIKKLTWKGHLQVELTGLDVAGFKKPLTQPPPAA